MVAAKSPTALRPRFRAVRQFRRRILDRDPPLLVMHDVSAQYGRVRALEQIEFTLRRGESLAILGANGAGKTTLLRTISGLMERRSGRILFEGADISRE